MNDYLEVGGLIIARLREQLPNLPVSPTWSLAEIKESPDLAPSLHVLLENDLPGDSSALGRCHKVEQHWAVLVVVRAEDVESDAGPLIADVIRVLAGWRPGPGYSPCHRVATKFEPDRTPGGFYYFPLTFATSFVFNQER